MFKKVIYPLLAAVLAALAFSGPVLAAEGDGFEILKARGRVTDVNTSAGKFSILTPSGTELRFFVDEDTRYAGQIAGLEDLEIGMGAGVAYTEKGEGKLTAVGVVGGRAPDLTKARGEVTAVDARLGEFEINTPQGDALHFFVDERTRYQGQLSSLEGLQVGWQAGVAARQGEDGRLIAVLVIAGERPDLTRAQGLVVEVDAPGGKFSLEKPDGELLQVMVTEGTRYQGQVESIADLEEGMRAGVAGILGSPGRLTARVVLAGDLREDRPEIVRAQGVIKTVSPGAEKFQLEKSDGSLVTVHVDSQTSYRGQVGGFGDLEKGQRAAFAGYLNSDGKIVARIVLAGEALPQRPGGDPPLDERPAPGGDLPLELPFTPPSG